MDAYEKAADISIAPDLDAILKGNRKAEFTATEKDEVCLTFIHQYGPEHELTGTKGLAYYAANRYRTMQKKHGVEMYPTPTKPKWLKVR